MMNNPPAGAAQNAGQIPPAGPRITSPRLAFLMALLFNPVVLISYLTTVYGPPTLCPVGPLCRFGEFPGVVQVALIVAGCGFLWLLLYVLLVRPIEAPGPTRSKPTSIRWLEQLSRVSAIRPLLAGYGSVFAVVVAWGILNGRINLPIGAIAVLAVFCCFYSAFGGRRRPRDPYGAIGSPGFQLRRLWPIRLFFPPNAGNGGGGGMGNPANDPNAPGPGGAFSAPPQP